MAITDVSKQRNAFFFRVRQFNKTSVPKDKGTSILPNVGRILPVDSLLQFDVEDLQTQS